MKLITKYFLICIFLCEPFLIRSQTGIQVAFEQADSLFKNGLFNEASLKFEEIRFFCKGKANKEKAISAKIECLKQQNKFEDAVHFIKLISPNEVNDSLRISLLYETALCAYLSGDFNTAKSQFVQLQFFSKKNNFFMEKLYLNALILNELHEWNEAEKILLDWIDSISINKDSIAIIKKSIIDLYDISNLPKLKNAKKAKVLSTFLPGSGQIYAGYIAEGVFNFMLHIATLGFATYEGLNTFYVTGYFGGLGLFQKFYYGGIKRTEYLVSKKNYEIIRKFNEESKNLIMSVK